MKPKALLLLEAAKSDLVYGPAERARLAELLEFVAPPQTAAAVAGLERMPAEVEVIVSSWGMPRLDARFLRQFPALKIVFYGAGSIRGFVTPESWARGVRVVSAKAANAIPAAEFSFAQIILALKRAWPQAQQTRAARQFVRTPQALAGTYRSTVGLLALGRIGRLVAARLQSLAVETLAYDPLVSPAEAAALHVRSCSLEEIFARADVVSCHVPLLPATRRLLRGSHFAAMKPGAVFLNTARGEVVAEDELIAALHDRPDLFAVLDVTDPEPPAPDSALYRLPNVLLTPHLAGCVGPECRRLGASIVEDVERFVRGARLENEVTEAMTTTAA